MRTKIKALRLAVLPLVAAATLAFTAVPAHAGTFKQSWSTEATKRSSADFLPVTGETTIGGMGCTTPGGGDLFDLQLMRTSDAHIMLSAGPQIANGTYFWLDDHQTVLHTAYYIRWIGDQSDLHSDETYTFCQGVEAKW